MTYELEGPYVVIAAIFVLWLGKFITDHLKFLERYSIPIAVTGGIICSLCVLLLQSFDGPQIQFNMELRDMLLLAFFSTIGISAKFARLKSGGRGLLILVAAAVVFLIVQDVVGVALAIYFDAHPGLGLFAGSVSLAGGHGTAIAWGREAANSGIANAAEVGIIFATFGLIAGGVIGGPIGEYLVRRHNLHSRDTSPEPPSEGKHPILSVNQSDSVLERALDVLFVLSACVVLGELVNEFLFEQNFKVPGFLTAMFAAILITNLSDAIDQPLRQDDFEQVGQLSLQLFLAMSLMSMDLSMLGEGLSQVMLVLGMQLLVITLFAVFVIFRILGRDYDAAVAASGFCGLGMGATPVAIANMNAITRKHGHSFKAFLIVPLVGAFFIDIANAMVVKFFIGLPLIANYIP